MGKIIVEIEWHDNHINSSCYVPTASIINDILNCTGDIEASDIPTVTVTKIPQPTKEKVELPKKLICYDQDVSFPDDELRETVNQLIDYLKAKE